MDQNDEMAWISVSDALDAGLIALHEVPPDPWCFWYETRTRHILHVGRPTSPTCVMSALMPTIRHST